MPSIKLLNSFKSTPVDDGGKASVAWTTRSREFSSQADITSNIVNPSSGIYLTLIAFNTLATIQIDMISDIEAGGI
jgi:hypothetical protein